MINAPEQAQNREVRIADPKDFLWLHQTISPDFTSGAPNPNKPGENLPGEPIAKVASDLKKNPKMAMDFPPLQIFTLTDPDSEIESTYSLSNRRLTAFKEGNVSEVKVQSAPYLTIFESLWKMTSVNGGYDQPKKTKVARQNDSFPSEETTLGQFRRDMESLMFVSEKYCETNGLDDQARAKYIEENVLPHAQRKYHLR